MLGQQVSRYQSRFDPRFDHRRRRPFPGWGTQREWPVLNPRSYDPRVYYYLAERSLSRLGND